MNKLIIGDTEFELEEYSMSNAASTPAVQINGKYYLGKAIPNTPKEKPPLGLEPRFISIQEKLNEIYSALRGYDAGKEIPKEWVDEKSELENFKIKAEKEKPKSFEILSFYIEANYPPFDIYNLRDDGLYVETNGDIGVTLDAMLHKGCCVDNGAVKIKTVKRISDSEIFTIGDKVERMDDNDTIDAFILNYKGNDMWVSTDVKNGYGSSLECAKKVKEVILTTDDGVDLYEGDRVWFVTASRNYEIEQHDFIKSDSSDELKAFHNIHKYFSTREAADNYVLMNRSCLSIQDIIDAYYLKALEKDNLIELAKKKLNGI